MQFTFHYCCRKTDAVVPHLPARLAACQGGHTCLFTQRDQISRGTHSDPWHPHLHHELAKQPCYLEGYEGTHCHSRAVCPSVLDIPFASMCLLTRRKDGKNLSHGIMVRVLLHVQASPWPCMGLPGSPACMWAFLIRFTHAHPFYGHELHVVDFLWSWSKRSDCAQRQF